MMMIFAIAASATILLLDLPSAIRSKEKKDIIIVSVLGLFVIVLAFLNALGVNLPKVMTLINELFMKLGIYYKM
ncbi:MAG: hypothetical protein ACOX5C_07365 [Acutalibacteraceae bacterium]|jgi:hypothetical protein